MNRKKYLRKLIAAFIAATYLFGISAQDLQADNSKQNKQKSEIENPQISIDKLAENLNKNTTSVLNTAAEKNNLTFGFVNFRRILIEIPQLSSINKNLDNEFAEQRKLIKSLQQELMALEEKNQINYSESLAQQIAVKQRELSRQEANLRDNYSMRRNEEVSKLQSLILNEVIALAKEEGIDVILNDTGVLYVSEKADLSMKVIQRVMKADK